MSKIQGRDVILQLGTDGVTYKTFVCEIEHGFDLKTSTTSVQHKCSQIAAVSVGATTAEIPFTGLVETNPTGSQASAALLVGWAIAKTVLYWKMEYPSGGAQLSRTGTGIITSYSESYPVDGLVQISGTLSVNDTITAS